jgi:transcriptional regulator with XRE-family HTH domain
MINNITSKQDSFDMVRIYRSTTKLSIEQVKQIRKGLESLEIGEKSQKELAKEFGVSQSTTSYIKIGKTWTCVQ